MGVDWLRPLPWVELLRGAWWRTNHTMTWRCSWLCPFLHFKAVALLRVKLRTGRPTCRRPNCARYRQEKQYTNTEGSCLSIAQREGTKFPILNESHLVVILSNWVLDNWVEEQIMSTWQAHCSGLCIPRDSFDIIKLWLCNLLHPHCTCSSFQGRDERAGNQHHMQGR